LFPKILLNGQLNVKHYLLTHHRTPCIEFQLGKSVCLRQLIKNRKAPLLLAMHHDNDIQ